LVWHSSENSILNREVSFLAILEIIFATFVYGGIAFYYDFYLHIITSIIFAPFLLLKSEYSIKFVLDKFSNLSCSKKIFLIYQSNIRIDIFVFFLYLISIHFTLSYFNNEISINKTLFIGLIFYIPMLYLGDILPIIFYATLLKILATMKYFFIGIRNISLNWIYSCFIVDIYKTPEIIVNIEEDDRISNDIKVSFFVKNIKDEKSLYIFFNRIVITIILYCFALFYRFSIKSTFWFYIPLLFLVKTPSIIEDNSQKVGEFLSSLYETYLAKLRFLLALIVLGLFLLTYFNFLEFNELNTSFKSFLFLFYVDFSSLEIWKILQILIAVLTIIIFLWADSVRRPKVSNKILLEKDLNFLSIFYLNILRNWISFFYFTSAFIYLSFYYNFWENSFIPNGIRNLFIYLNELILWIPFSLI
jgi:hypothetical protein